MTKEAKMTTGELDENLVADYLGKHPDFFTHRDQLILQMNLPHQRDGAVSLVEKQVALLRERNRNDKKKMDGFIQAAKDNDAIFINCQKLVLSLVDAKDSEEFFAALEQSFRNDFKCSAYSLIAFEESPRTLSHFASAVPEDEARKYVGALMKSKNPTLGVLRPTEQEFLFHNQSAMVKSAAVIPVKRDRQPLALLAIGSSDPHYFQAGMGTLFVGFIADTLSRFLPRFVNLS